MEKVIRCETCGWIFDMEDGEEIKECLNCGSDELTDVTDKVKYVGRGKEIEQSKFEIRIFDNFGKGECEFVEGFDTYEEALNRADDEPIDDAKEHYAIWEYGDSNEVVKETRLNSNKEIIGGEMKMDKVKCAYCGKEFDMDEHQEDTEFSVEYGGFVCSDCYHDNFGYCDGCGDFFEYHDKMIEHSNLGVRCKKCLSKVEDATKGLICKVSFKSEGATTYLVIMESRERIHDLFFNYNKEYDENVCDCTFEDYLKYKGVKYSYWFADIDLEG